MYLIKYIYKNIKIKKTKPNEKKNPSKQKSQINKQNPKNLHGFSLGKYNTSLNSIIVSSIKELVKLEVYKSVKIFCLGDTKQ